MRAGRAGARALQPGVRCQLVDSEPLLGIVGEEALDEALGRFRDPPPGRVTEVEASAFDARLDLDKGHLTAVGLVRRLAGQHRVLQRRRQM